jgi:gliding motility-associated-like protein
MPRTKPYYYLCRVLAIGLLLVICNTISAQKQNNQWRYATHSGADFNGTRPVRVSTSSMESWSSCMSVADRNTGALLFYSDGITVWDAQDQAMPNGHALRGSLASVQGGQIVPRPGYPNQYYLFVIARIQGLSYNLIDMSLRGGLGDIVAGQKNIPLISNVHDRIQSVPTCDRQGYWVLALELGGLASMYAYKVTAAGVELTPVVSYVQFSLRGNGNFKINHQLNRLAASDPTGFLLLDFDNGTGMVSTADPDYILGPSLPRPALGPRSPFAIPDETVRGIEFSPDGKRLYATVGGHFFQYNLALPTMQQVKNSALDLGHTRYRQQSFFFLQRAPDGSIYEGTVFMSMITNPNVLGAGCGFKLKSNLFSEEGISLPTWVFDNSYGRITVSDTCAGSSTRFGITDTLQVTTIDWNFGDQASGSNNMGSGVHPTHVFNTPGIYTVTATIYRDCGSSQVLNLVVHSVDCCSVPNSPFADFKYGSDLVCTNMGVVSPLIGSGFASGGTFAGNTGLSLNPSTGAIDVSATVPGTYSIIYTVQPVACPSLVKDSATITVKSSPAPPVVVSPVTLCQFAPPPAWQVSGEDIRWLDSATDTLSSARPPRIDSSDAGSFTVYVTQGRANGCRSNTVPVVITVWPQPEVYAGGPTLQITLGESLNPQAEATSGSALLWEPGSFSELRPLLTPLKTTDYKLTATSTQGCTNSDSVHVIVSIKFKVPNVFTPNGDGINDSWVIQYLDTYPGLTLEVYSRSGERVYNRREGALAWNGTFKGKPLPPGTYYWIINPGNGWPVQKGFVDLIR